jgi:NAD(P)-dependent dehydrogenase (short-subunit alcohol dehydrogenase family)
MKIEGSVALVTGANRGIGKAIVEALRDNGATRIYATARNVDSLVTLVATDPDRIVPLALDVTDSKAVHAVAKEATDVSLLVNNAGVAHFTGFMNTDDAIAAQTDMNVNYFGTLSMIRAFAPHLKTNGGGAIVNIASIASLVNFPMLGSYSASKAANHSLTQGVRGELKAQDTLVIGVYPGPVDTDMVRDVDMPKVPPSQVASAILEAVTNGTEDVFPDETAANLHAGLLSDPKGTEQQVGTMLPN